MVYEYPVFCSLCDIVVTYSWKGRHFFDPPGRRRTTGAMYVSISLSTGCMHVPTYRGAYWSRRNAEPD